MDNFDEKYNIRLYDDNLLPLYKLYSIEKVIEEICSKKIWLKSGAYLVIEPTEAMTVIDVNTGKCNKGKKLSETIPDETKKYVRNSNGRFHKYGK